MSDRPKCELCGEPMPEGEEMFKYHGYSGNCPKPPLPKSDTPRTDALKLPSEVLLPASEKYLGYSVKEAIKILGDHARQLERELSAQSSREKALVEVSRKVLRFIRQNHWRYGYAEGIWDMNSSGVIYDEVKAALKAYEGEL